MQTFKDAEGREWPIVVDVAALKRVRSHIDVDLLQITSGDLLPRLVQDPILLCDVIYVLCKPKADADQITDEQFGQALIGDVIDHATAAFMEALADFFPTAQRLLIKKAMGRVGELKTAGLELLDKKLDDPKLIQDLERELGRSFGSSPES